MQIGSSNLWLIGVFLKSELNEKNDGTNPAASETGGSKSEAERKS
jgi:hypothetical protein